uniref:Alpha-2-HS-glycoprotein 2 n=1 Tax=Astatotilapia calliptera TaxID=8154 RepID=A0A3P8PI62_ASTCA
MTTPSGCPTVLKAHLFEARVHGSQLPLTVNFNLLNSNFPLNRICWILRVTLIQIKNHLDAKGSFHTENTCTPDGDEYDMEVDLLETDCHVLDPLPLANCTVRPKVQTAVEGDCDVVLKKVGGVLKVIAFKCKSEVSTEDLCLGCPSLLPLNNTDALDFVHASLTTFNNMTVNTTHVLLEVGRLSSQVRQSGYFLPDIPIVDANSTAAADPVLPPVVHVHTHGLSHKHGHSHHKLTALHNPHQNVLLSAESAEVVPVVPAAAAPAADYDSAGESLTSKEPPLFFRKRDVSAAIMVDAPAVQTGPVSLVPVCPGRVRFF